jgi:adenosine kinase
MRILVTGSIATDYLMTFPGSIAQQILPSRIDRISLSFLVNYLDVRRGGVAANIAVGLRRLGVEPILVGGVGSDFTEYRRWLEDNDVSTKWTRVSVVHQTSRFLCTTDIDGNQIASFYPGAMAEARFIELAPVVEAVGGVDLVLVSPNDPEAMVRHTQECRRRGYPFAADPSQQLARLDGEEIARLVDGATYLFANSYESGLILDKTGWSEDELLRRVGMSVVTHGPAGVRVDRAEREPVTVPAIPDVEAADPTGSGDAFRAGFLAGMAWGLTVERAAQLGCVLASVVLESIGTQDYVLDRDNVLARLTYAYGAEAAEIRPYLPAGPSISEGAVA